MFHGLEGLYEREGGPLYLKVIHHPGLLESGNLLRRLAQLPELHAHIEIEGDAIRTLLSSPPLPPPIDPDDDAKDITQDLQALPLVVANDKIHLQSNLDTNLNSQTCSKPKAILLTSSNFLVA
ncbi:hypothetical protein DXG01_001618 [Tephrocybe rancida]|nr:hypothetical protein DXG01_001618 [Tephrocybe rancida]